MNRYIAIILQRLASTFPSFFRSRKIETADGIIQKPSKAYNFLFIFLVFLNLFIAIFAIIGTKISIDSGEIHPMAVVFWIMALPLSVFLLYYYIYYIKAYYAESSEGLIFGNAKGEKRIRLEDIESYKTEYNRITLYNKENEKFILNTEFFNTPVLSKYLSMYFQRERRGFLSARYIRKTKK